MITIDKKINAVMRAMTAEDSGSYEAAMLEIRKCMESGQTQSAGNTAADAEEYISDILVELGVPNHVKGYSYLLTAIDMVIRDPDLLGAVTKVLYCEVGKTYGTTASRTERAMRHAIEVCWDRIDLDTVVRYFGNTVSPLKGKPTNSEFIARVANVVRRRMKAAA